MRPVTDNDPFPEITLPSGDVMRTVPRYADVREVLSDPRFTRELHRAADSPRIARGADISDDRDSLLNMDPPRHTKLRRTVTGAFTPRRVATWQPRIDEITDRLLTELTTAGPPADLMAAFAFPLPILVICELLGVPGQDRERFRDWAASALTTATEAAEERARARREFYTYISELLAARRATPGDALIDALLTARDGDDMLTERELVSLIENLITAGHETTTNLIGGGIFTLLSEGHYEALAQDPALLPGFAEELLRHDSPAPYAMPRLATEDVELPSGLIRRGQTVLPLVTAANRDPSVYPDPETFDPDRAGQPHLTFGHGPHFCLGANLAKLELERALTALTKRLPGLALAVPAADVSWRTGGLVNGPERLPVTW